GKLVQIQCEHQRMQTVRPQVADDPGAVIPIFSPPEESLRAPCAFGRRSQPRLPVDGLFSRLWFKRVVPFTVGIVAAVAALRPKQAADRPGGDQVPGTVILRIAAAVR